ncbi:protein-L-isoaspartate O-methyltransferase family protein [Enterovirga aerilata]|uniref:Protein-L-isoaspartate O-methyltransferase n=1 Tax=Enterovirga aerilata TaxID=2730920 RepID=A0A849I3L0_9HYPH|nr:protein-L-isoaspartate O-methyltransferase [Enterovirga sp. DB1703]NNM71948.1 protein-L-isoaspartate O-methyltransferase [Enterovirga sp. DB1703]
MLDFARARRNMVDNQLRTFDVTDRAVLAAMAEIPRERFVPESQAAFAYLDRNVNVAEGGAEPRWMLQPMVLARMVQELEIEPGARALDVATGHGYAAALLSTLGAEVVALESDEALAAAARSALAGAGRPAEVVVGPLAKGHPPRAPYDVILVNGAVEERPDALLAQLKEGGRLACLVREGAAGHAMLYVRAGSGFGLRRLFDASAPVLREFRAEPSFQF